MNKGDRVGALYHSDKDKKIYQILGYGVYQGEEVPLEAVGLFANTAKELKIKNPKILLDSGEVVYGCECWWGSESQVQNKIESAKDAGYEIVIVSMNKIRGEYKANESN